MTQGKDSARRVEKRGKNWEERGPKVFSSRNPLMVKKIVNPRGNRKGR